MLPCQPDPSHVLNLRLARAHMWWCAVIAFRLPWQIAWCTAAATLVIARLANRRQASGARRGDAIWACLWANTALHFPRVLARTKGGIGSLLSDPTGNLAALADEDRVVFVAPLPYCHLAALLVGKTPMPAPMLYLTGDAPCAPRPGWLQRLGLIDTLADPAPLAPLRALLRHGRLLVGVPVPAGIPEAGSPPASEMVAAAALAAEAGARLLPLRVCFLRPTRPRISVGVALSAAAGAPGRVAVLDLARRLQRFYAQPPWAHRHLFAR